MTLKFLGDEQDVKNYRFLRLLSHIQNLYKSSSKKIQQIRKLFQKQTGFHQGVQYSRPSNNSCRLKNHDITCSFLSHWSIMSKFLTLLKNGLFQKRYATLEYITGARYQFITFTNRQRLKSQYNLNDKQKHILLKKQYKKIHCPQNF